MHAVPLDLETAGDELHPACTKSLICLAEVRRLGLLVHAEVRSLGLLVLPVLVRLLADPY